MNDVRYKCTKYMVFKADKEKPEAVEEKVKEEIVQETKEYKYVGLVVNEKRQSVNPPGVSQRKS